MVIFVFLHKKRLYRRIILTCFHFPRAYGVAEGGGDCRDEKKERCAPAASCRSLLSTRFVFVVVRELMVAKQRMPEARVTEEQGPPRKVKVSETLCHF